MQPIRKILRDQSFAGYAAMRAAFALSVQHALGTQLVRSPSMRLNGGKGAGAKRMHAIKPHSIWGKLSASFVIFARSRSMENFAH